MVVMVGGRGGGGGSRGRSRALGGVMVVGGVGRSGLSGWGAGGTFSPSAAKEGAQERGGVGDGAGGRLVGFGGGSRADPPHRRTAGLGAGAADDGALRGERGGVKASHAPLPPTRPRPVRVATPPFCISPLTSTGRCPGGVDKINHAPRCGHAPFQTPLSPKYERWGGARLGGRRAWLSKATTERPRPSRLGHAPTL